MAAGGEAIVMVAPDALMVMLTGLVVVSCGLLESVARIVGVLVPATVGVPVTVQPDPNASPLGSEPETTVQV